ncbi:MAG: hypothetical protein AB7T19_05465 [Planctomycetota bacterium]
MAAPRDLALRLGLGIASCALAGCDFETGNERSSEVEKRPEPAPSPAIEGTPIEVVAAIVRRTHGPRAGGFDRVALELRESQAGPPVSIRASLPSLMKVTWPDGSWAIARDEEVRGGTSADDDRPADEALRATTLTLRSAIDSLCLGPLTRAASAERLDHDTLRIVERSGARHELDYDPSTAAVVALRSGSMELRILEDLDRAGIARVFVRVLWSELGERHVRFLDTGLAFANDSFASPKSPVQSRGPELVVGGPRPTLVPRLARTEAVRWLMHPDPGDWPGRMAIFHGVGARLGPLGYGNGGDPMLVQDANRAWFVIPFVAVEAEPRPVVIAESERLVECARERVATVDAEPGPWEERIQRSTAVLGAFLRERNLNAIGEARLAVNLVGSDPAGDPTSLARLPLRVVIPVR